MAGSGYWGSGYWSGSYFAPRYWGLTDDTTAGSMIGQAVGIANVTGDLSGFAVMSASVVGLATAMATLSEHSMSGTATGSCTVVGVLVNGDVALPPEHISTGSGGPAAGRRARRKKRLRPDELTVEEQLDLARARGRLRKLDDLWGHTEPIGLPRWEEMVDELDLPASSEAAKGVPNRGPAFMIPKTDSFEKFFLVSEASKRVVDQILAEARASAAATVAYQQEVLKRLAEDEEEEEIELLLLDLF